MLSISEGSLSPTQAATVNNKVKDASRSFTIYRVNSSYFINPGLDIVLKDKPDINISNKISFLNKNSFLDLFHLFNDRNKGEGYMLHHDFESEQRFQEMADLFTLSIT